MVWGSVLLSDTQALVIFPVCHLLHGGLCPHGCHLVMAATSLDMTKGKGKNLGQLSLFIIIKALLEALPHDFCFIQLARLDHMANPESLRRGWGRRLAQPADCESHLCSLISCLGQ